MKEHTYTAFSVAKVFCELSDWNITNLKLQKLTYLAQMTYMGFNEGERLIDDDFEAWQYGPVNKNLYTRLSAFGSKPVLNVFKHDENLCTTHRDHVNKVFNTFGSMDSWRLVEITHRKGGAWDKTYNPIIAMKNIISDQSIMDEFYLYND